MKPTARIPVPGRRIASRLVAGRAVLLDPSDDKLQRLNDVGSFVWERVLERTHSVDAIIVAVSETFEVDAVTARADVEAFLGDLAERGFIEWDAARTSADSGSLGGAGSI